MSCAAPRAGMRSVPSMRPNVRPRWMISASSPQLVFSTFSGRQYLHHAEMAVRYGGIRAHNRAMAEFCKDDPRLIAVGQLALADPDRCVEELREGVRLGCGAFWIPGQPVGDKSPGHPDFDRVWQAFCDLGVPFMLHVGPNSPTKIPAYEHHGK